MKVGVDLDGVVYDFVGSLKNYLVMVGWKTPEEIPPATSWTFYKDWGLTTDEFLDVCADGVDQGFIFRLGPPLPGAVGGMERLQNAGHTLHIVTNRSFGSHSVSNTEAWLHDYHIPFDSLTFSDDKTLVRTDVFIDDYVKNYDELEAANVRSVLFDQPWNRDADKALRVHNWGEFTQLVKVLDHSSRAVA